MKKIKLVKEATTLISLVMAILIIQTPVYSTEITPAEISKVVVKNETAISEVSKATVHQQKVNARRVPSIAYKEIGTSVQSVVSKNLKKESVHPVKGAEKKVSNFKNPTGLRKYAVFIGGKHIVTFDKPYAGYSPEQRAKILVSRLKQFELVNGNPKLIMPAKEQGSVVIRANKETLFTLDAENAKVLKLSVPEYALQMTNTIRQALGSPILVRDSNLLASRGFVSYSFARRYMARPEVGIASWYGGIFNGRKAADGSIFSTYKFTAAHKTLPFGSVVRVTNTRNGKSCLVKITDRGPFVAGRVIDLSSAAAREIGILDSGVSQVKLEIVDRI